MLNLYVLVHVHKLCISCVPVYIPTVCMYKHMSPNVSHDHVYTSQLVCVCACVSECVRVHICVRVCVCPCAHE